MLSSLLNGQAPCPPFFAHSFPPASLDPSTKAVPAGVAAATPFNGIFVDIGNVVNGLAPSIQWKALYRHLLTEVIGAPDGSRFDANVCFYNVKSRAEQDAAQQLQHATGAAAVASSLQKNDSDGRLIAHVRRFVDNMLPLVPNGARPPYGYVVLVTGDVDFSEIAEFSAGHGFVPLAASFSDRISHALVQKIYECRGDTLDLDRFAVPADRQYGRPAPRPSASSPMDVFAPAFASARSSVRSGAFSEGPAARPMPDPFGGDSEDGEPPQAASVPVHPMFPAFPLHEAPGRGGIFEESGDDGAESVPKFEDREKVQDFVVGHVLERLPSDIVLDGLDRRIMRTVTGLWKNGRTPTFSHTSAAIASRTGQSEETVRARLHSLLVDELLVTRELRYRRGDVTLTSQALVPTRRGIAAARLTSNAVSDDVFSH